MCSWPLEPLEHPCMTVHGNVLSLLSAIGGRDVCAAAGHDQLKASPEIRRLQLCAVNALLLHDATFQHLTKTHHAQLLHHLAGAYGHLDSTDARRPELFQQLQELQA